MNPMRVKIYRRASQEKGRESAATVLLARAPESDDRFKLVNVQPESTSEAKQIRGILDRATVGVWKANIEERDGVQTHGKYAAEEPYGSVTYWRAIFGELPKHGYEYDQHDYSAMLTQMEQESSLLVLARDGWKWLTGGVRRLLTDADINQKKPVSWQINVWSMQSIRGFGADGPPPKLSLIAKPSDESFALNVEVRPMHSNTLHRTIWELTFSIAPDSVTPEVDIALGRSAEQHTGMHTLREGTDIVFVEPPPAECLWLHCEWLPAGAEWRAEKIRLPLLDRSDE